MDDKIKLLTIKTKCNQTVKITNRFFVHELLFMNLFIIIIHFANDFARNQLNVYFIVELSIGTIDVLVLLLT